jgi:redox-sensing transcriptional repressor
VTERGSVRARRRAGGRAGIPDATVARLPLYLRSLHSLADDGRSTVSSEELARLVGGGAGSPAKVRKDLSHLGSYGTRGVGYDVAQLVSSISTELGLARRWPVVLVGVGNLGHALAGYAGFASRGFRIAALFDADPARVGELVGGLRVRPMGEVGDVVREQGVAIGVIATPAEAAQQVCDRLVEAGIRSVLNFAPTGLQVPDGVDVRKVDLAVELQILSFHEHRKTAAQQQVEVLA